MKYVTEMLNVIGHNNNHFSELEMYEWLNDDDNIKPVTNDDVDNDTEKDCDNDD